MLKDKDLQNLSKSRPTEKVILNFSIEIYWPGKKCKKRDFKAKKKKEKKKRFAPQNRPMHLHKTSSSM